MNNVDVYGLALGVTDVLVILYSRSSCIVSKL